MTGQPKPVTRLEQLGRDVDRTRAEYFAEHGEDRDRLWEVYQRALKSWNAAVANANQSAARGEA